MKRILVLVRKCYDRNVCVTTNYYKWPTFSGIDNSKNIKISKIWLVCSECNAECSDMERIRSEFEQNWLSVLYNTSVQNKTDLFLHVLFINVISVLIKLGEKRSGYVKCNYSLFNFFN